MSHFWHIKMKLFSLCYFPSSVPAAWKLILVYFWLIFLIQPEFPHSLPPGLSAGSYSSSPFLLPHLSPRGLWASALPLLETPRTFHDWGMSNSTTAFISRVGFYHQPRRKRRQPPAFGKRGQETLSGRSGKGCQKDASFLAVLLAAGTTPRPPLPHPRAHQRPLLPCNLSPPPHSERWPWEDRELFSHGPMRA